MEHRTACYWQKEAQPKTFLSLQQRYYRRRKTSVVIACMAGSREGEVWLRRTLERRLEQPGIWRTWREETLQESLRAELAETAPVEDYAGILCVREKVLFCAGGRMKVCGCFRRFGRTEWMSLQGQCRAGSVEAGTALLLADNAFLTYCEDRIAECLRPGAFGTDRREDDGERARKRLEELGSYAEQLGGRHMGAVWILPVPGDTRRGRSRADSVRESEGTSHG